MPANVTGWAMDRRRRAALDRGGGEAESCAGG